MAEEKIILKVSLDGAQKEIDNLNKLQKGVKTLGEEKKRLNKNEKELTKAINESGVATKQQADELKKINEKQVQNNTSLKLAKTAYRENEQQVLRAAKANQANTGSLVQMRAALAKDQRAFDLLTKSERENEKVGGLLQKRIKAQSTELLNLEKNTGRAQRNVGNYGEAVNDVLPLMGGFGTQIQMVQRSLTTMKSAIAKTSTAQKGMAASTAVTNKGLKAFRIALISTGIGAIVVALGTLIAAFLSTQRGVDALTSVLRPLQEIFQSIIGVVQDFATKGVDALKKAFKDPKQALLDLGEAIKENLITRVLAVPKLIKAAAKSYINAFKLIGLGIKKVLADVPLIGKLIDKDQLEKDLETTKEDIKNSLSDLKDASIEFGIGVDAEKVKEAAGEVADFIDKSSKRGQEIDRLTKQIETSQITLNRELSKGLRIFEEQRSIAEDTNNSTAVRLEAAQKAQEQLKANAKLETDQLNRRLKLAELEAEANDTDREAKEEIQNIIAEKEAVEARVLKKGLLLRNKANSIEQKAEKERIKAIKDKAKAEQKAIDDKTKAEIKAIDKKIELMKLERQLELATIDETDKEKFEKEKALLDKIAALKLEKAKKSGEDLTQAELENEIKKAELLKEEKVRQDEIKKEEQAVKDEEEAERIRLKEENLKEIKNAAIAAGEQFVDQAFQNQNRRIDEGVEREVEALNLKKQAGEITEEEFNKKRLEIDKKAFKDRKRLSQGENVIDFAVAAGKTLASFGFTPQGVAALIPLGIQAATQAAIIQSQKFEKGGIINGPSHAFGGVNIGNNQEAEGGEAIINKRSTAKHFNLLSAINQDGGGVPFTGASAPNTGTLAKFGNGGIASTTNVTTQTLDLEDLENRISAAVGSIQVQNVASETTGVANRVQQIEDSASF